MDGPAAPDEMADAEECDHEQDEPEAGIEHELDLPVGEKPYHRSYNATIGVASTNLCHPIGAAVVGDPDADADGSNVS